MNENVFEFFKTFADLQRMRITVMLADEALTVEEIAVRLQMKAVDVPRHLALIEKLGLLAQDGDKYRLDRKAFETLSRSVWTQKRPQVQIQSNDQNADEFDQKVVRDYSLPDGRLREIPLSGKKFAAVLRHVVYAIEPGKRYTEKEINEVLKRFNEDTATLRRGLYDFGLLQRELNGSAYWREEQQPTP